MLFFKFEIWRKERAMNTKNIVRNFLSFLGIVFCLIAIVYNIFIGGISNTMGIHLFMVSIALCTLIVFYVSVPYFKSTFVAIILLMYLSAGIIDARSSIYIFSSWSGMPKIISTKWAYYQPFSYKWIFEIKKSQTLDFETQGITSDGIQVGETLRVPLKIYLSDNTPPITDENSLDKVADAISKKKEFFRRCFETVVSSYSFATLYALQHTTPSILVFNDGLTFSPIKQINVEWDGRILLDDCFTGVCRPIYNTPPE